jgi:hypothetical protein
MNILTIDSQIDELSLVLEPDELRLAELAHLEIEAPEA